MAISLVLLESCSVPLSHLTRLVAVLLYVVLAWLAAVTRTDMFGDRETVSTNMFGQTTVVDQVMLAFGSVG